MTTIRKATQRATTVVRAVRRRTVRWAITPPTIDKRLAELESAIGELRDRLNTVAAHARDAQRLSNEDGRALQFVLLDVNEIRRDLDGLLEGERP